MASWYRTWHGLPCDPKLRNVAKRCTRSIPEVLSVYMALLDFASQAEPRGSIEGIDPEDIEAMYDLDDAASILSAMKGKLHDGKSLTGWSKRQPDREDSSTDRVRKHRERKRRETQCNADETTGNAPETEQSRTEQIKQTTAPEAVASVVGLSEEVEQIAGADSSKSQYWAMNKISAVDAWLAKADAQGIGSDRARELILDKVREVRAQDPQQQISRPSYFNKAIDEAIRLEKKDRTPGGFQAGKFGKPRVKATA